VAGVAREHGDHRPPPRLPPPPRASYDLDASPQGALFVGSPQEVAERIVALHGSLGHMRHFFQMDFGSLPQRDFLRSIELLGTKVKPLVDAELAVARSEVGA